jgi:hypothetical protein
MLSEQWRMLARKYIVYDIPLEMAACFDCGAARCPNAMYQTCLARLARAGSDHDSLPTDRRAGGDRFAAVLDVRHRADAR